MTTIIADTNDKSEAQTHDFVPKVRHYIHREDSAFSRDYGIPVNGLCGEFVVVAPVGNGGAFVICPLCADIYEGLPA
ncbi:hypothetical protein GCM10027591_03680 [Zhihengliuella somnathii]